MAKIKVATKFFIRKLNGNFDLKKELPNRDIISSLIHYTRASLFLL